MKSAVLIFGTNQDGLNRLVEPCRGIPEKEETEENDKDKESSRAN
jgi:hypothetical protein